MGNAFEMLSNSMPAFDSSKPLQERVDELQDYVFQLLEYLRYLLYNLDPSKNFNEAALEEYNKLITEPVYAQIADEAGNVAKLVLTAEALQSQLTNLNGDISTLTQTAQGLQVQVSNIDGDMSTLRQTATGIQTQVSNLNGQMSSVLQTAAGLSVTVSNLQGNYSKLTQTVNGITISGPGGTTLINGAAIATGSIAADSIDLTRISNLGSPYNTVLNIRSSGVNIDANATGISGMLLDVWSNTVDFRKAGTIRFPHHGSVYVTLDNGSEISLYNYVKLIISQS